MEDLELVNKIEKIELEPTGNPPVHYLIKVTGSVRRTGYKVPLLIVKSTTPDSEGKLTYYFGAQPPIGGAPGNSISIEAKRYLYELQGVRKLIFVSATNEMESNV